MTILRLPPLRQIDGVTNGSGKFRCLRDGLSGLNVNVIEAAEMSRKRSWRFCVLMTLLLLRRWIPPLVWRLLHFCRLLLHPNSSSTRRLTDQMRYLHVCHIASDGGIPVQWVRRSWLENQWRCRGNRSYSFPFARGGG